MKTQTNKLLKMIRKEIGKEYGKVVQKLLAIALLESQVQRLVDRCVQGIDLEFEIGGEKVFFEVKTSEGSAVKISSKDLQGLDRLREEHEKIYFAVLVEGPFEDWIFARYSRGEFPAGKDLSSFFFRGYRDKSLEARVRPHFDKAVETYAPLAISSGQNGLNEVLQKYSEWKRA